MKPGPRFAYGEWENGRRTRTGWVRKLRRRRRTDFGGRVATPPSISTRKEKMRASRSFPTTAYLGFYYAFVRNDDPPSQA